jgi:hypothetical protein
MTELELRERKLELRRATAFGFLWLWQAPSIAAKFGREMQIALSPPDHHRP